MRAGGTDGQVNAAKVGQRRLPLSVQILVGMALGLVVGPFVGGAGAPLGEVGKVVIATIKGVATPLLFLSIVHAVVKTDVSGRGGVRLFGFAFVNASLALGLGLLLANVLRPGDMLRDAVGTGSSDAAAAYAGKKIDFAKSLLGYIPKDLVSPFLDNAVISVVILALVFGFAFKRARARASGHGGFAAIDQGIEALLAVTEVILRWAIRLVPLAVFATVAKTVGEYGYAPLRGLSAFLVVALGGLALHVLVVYQLWLVVYVRLPLRAFWRIAKVPVIYALGANSSLATLPVTLEALRRLRVSESSSALGACVGTNLNNDGILLYEGMAVLFVAQASGIELSVAEQAFALLACMVAAMGVAGVPEAGFISLALVLNTVGLPLEILPLILTVDWVIARARSVTNVLSDMLLSLLIERACHGALAADTAR
jgi:Na+/H+-dicarboxylate symporter